MSASSRERYGGSRDSCSREGRRAGEATREDKREGKKEEEVGDEDEEERCAIESDRVEETSAVTSVMICFKGNTVDGETSAGVLDDNPKNAITCWIAENAKDNPRKYKMKRERTKRIQMVKI